MTSVRRTKIQRLGSSVSSSSRKVVPMPSVHSSSFNEEETTFDSNNFKQEKFYAGQRATESHDYIEAIKQYSLIKPDTPMSLYHCACARLEMKYYFQTQEAIVDLTKCLGLASHTNQPQLTLQIWFKLAQAYHTLGRYEDAIRDYTEFIQRCKILGEEGKMYLPKGLVGRGLTHQSLYELDSALKDFDEANRLTSENVPYYLACRAGVYVARNDPKQVDEDLKKMSQLDYEKDSDALLQRAIVFYELAKYDAALDELRKALAIIPYPNELTEIYYQIGRNEQALHHRVAALHAFEQAISLHPFHARAYFQLGLMQTEKNRPKQALKTLHRAHELAPQDAEILLQLAIVNEQLGNVDEAADDRQRAQQLKLLPSTKLAQLIKHIKELQSNGSKKVSTNHWLELAMSYDGLLDLKKRPKARMEHYQPAIIAYQNAIDTDTKHTFPQARALLILCHIKMNAYLDAHPLHLQFYQILAEHSQAVVHWKTFLVQVEDQIESGQSAPYFNQIMVSKLIQIEFNRRKNHIDEEKYQNDGEDEEKNQLAFYRELRVELANLLVAIAVLNLPKERITLADRLKRNQVERMIEILSQNPMSLNEIESILIGDFHRNNKEIDYDLIRMRLKSLGDVGDPIDHVDVAQLVARHLCTRYRSQLICLIPTINNVQQPSVPIVEKSSCWSCRSRRSSIQKQETLIEQKTSIEKLTNFAIALLIYSIVNDFNRFVPSQRTSKKDALGTRLVLMISRAHTTGSNKRLNNEQRLPISQSAVVTMLQKTMEPTANFDNAPTHWDLHEFFQAPGIYYYSNGDTGDTYYYGSAEYMRADLYGYRLGAPEEVDSLKEKHHISRSTIVQSQKNKRK